MKARSIWEYIYFGTSLRYLQDARAGMPINEERCVLWNIDSFLACLHEFDLPVTQRASRELLKVRRLIVEHSRGSVLAEEKARELSYVASVVRDTLQAEAEGKLAYVVTEKRLDVTKLLDNVPGLLAAGVFDALPSMAQDDLCSAGRCIAFALPTAAAFHMLRAVEATIRLMYRTLKLTEPQRLDWGSMEAQLKDARLSVPKVITDVLAHLREGFRNPTFHPDKSYDIDEAQDLFSLTVDAMNRILKYLQEHAAPEKGSTSES